MGKISPVSAKYIIHASITIDGVVDRPDVIGAIFGQTEGLLGSELELRELQRSGRIGRIEVNSETRSGKTQGSIIIPSSLDKAETSIVGAALEIIERIGPCNAKISVQNIEDVRISKRQQVVERAKELLRKMMDGVLPDSQELADEVAYSVRVMEIKEYGQDRLPAGPAIDESDDVVIVEGRADVLNLLKHGIKNAIAINGSSVPQTIVDLCKKKEITLFVDGDRGGILNAKALLDVCDIDFVTRAPDGKEVEEITKKEIHKALRSRITAEQAKMEFGGAKESLAIKTMSAPESSREQQRPMAQRPRPQGTQAPPTFARHTGSQSPPRKQLSDREKSVFREMLENLIGTKGAYLLDNKLTILGKVPLPELETTIKSVTGVYAVILDGIVDRTTAQTVEKAEVNYVVGMDSKVRPNETRVNVVTAAEL